MKNNRVVDRTFKVLRNDSPFNVIEAYRSLRTNVIFSLAGEGCKKIMITSSFPGEGKTTTCVNLAITFAQTGAKVLVVDCDLRKSRIHRCFNIKRVDGLSSVLSGLKKAEDIIVHDDESNLDILMAGHIPPNPAELLASEAMADFLEEYGEKYDYIFLDTPPVNVVTDALVLSKLVSGVLMVAWQMRSDHKVIREALERLELAGAKPIGFVLNDVVEGSSKYGYSYRDKYKYKYKYKYDYQYGDKK